MVGRFRHISARVRTGETTAHGAAFIEAWFDASDEPYKNTGGSIRCYRDYKDYRTYDLEIKCNKMASSASVESNESTGNSPSSSASLESNESAGNSKFLSVAWAIVGLLLATI